VQTRRSIQFFLVSIGIALLFAGLFFDTGTVASMKLQVTGTPVVPTVDRLAEPTLPALPSQADKGSQVYWLSCMPCHGDWGQGLTTEFRNAYPEEDRNCWNSGCHGNRPYLNGFTLPQTVPALIGTGTLQKFPNAAVLRAYIFAAMPFWKPGSLTEEETLQITAFLLRQNNLWSAQQDITMENAADIPVGPPPATPTPQPSLLSRSISGSYLPFIVIGVVLILLLFLQRRHRKSHTEN
jgi:cytochrome c